MIFKANIKRAIYGLYDLDPIDHKIIAFLQENGRESFSKIADEIGVPASTVRDRTNRMIESGVIRIVARVNPMNADPRVHASIGIKLSGGQHRLVADEIGRNDEVERLVIGTGNFDLLAEVSCRDNEHLLDTISLLQEMPQVQGTESFIHFSTPKETVD